MDEQRIRDYLNLIQELLSCPNGEEPQILNHSSDLIDEGFVQVCVAMASKLEEAGQENQVSFLIDLAEQLAEYLNMTEDGEKEQESQSDHSLEDYQKFLQQLIQIEIQSNSDPKIVYRFLAQHQNKLDLKFAEIITQWFNSIIDPNNSKRNQALASLLNSIAIYLCEFPLGSRSNNLEIAITCSTNALTVYTKDAFPVQWANTQNNLGIAYLHRINGVRDDNLARAIASFKSALTIYTKDAFPEDWEMIKNDLRLAESIKMKGKKGNNLTKQKK